MTRGSLLYGAKSVAVVEHTVVHTLSTRFCFTQTHMLWCELSKFKAFDSKGFGRLYHCFKQKGRLLGDRGDIWGRERGRKNERERMRRVRRVRERQRVRQRRREGVRQGKKRRRGHDCTLSTAFCGPLCRCHQLFPCTEGSRAWNIASGPVLGHLSSVNQTGGVGGGGGEWGAEDRLREAGERGSVVEGRQRGPTDWASVTVLRTVPAICHWFSPLPTTQPAQ